MNLLVPHGLGTDRYLVEAAKAMGHTVHFMCNVQEMDRLDSIRMACDPDVWVAVPTRFDQKMCNEEYLDWYAGFMTSYVKDHKISAILPCTSMDIVSLEVAQVNEWFGLPGITPEQARMFRDKAEYLPLLESEGVPTPRIYEIVRPRDEPRDYDLPYPVLAKPGLGSGGYGIYVAEDIGKLKWFFGPSDNPDGFSERALFYQDRDFANRPKSYLHFGMGGRYVVQEYVEGPCISLAGTTAGGVLELDLAYDIGITPPPTCAEVTFAWPSSHAIADAAERCRAGVEAAFASVGLPDGAWMLDAIWDGRELLVVDFSPRMSSSGTKMLYHTCGSPAYAANVISCMLHGTRDFKVTPKTPTSYHMLPFPKGKLTNIRYPDLGVDSHAVIAEKELPIQGEGRVFEMRNDIQVSDRGWVVGQALEGDREGADHIVERFIEGIEYDLV